MTTKLNSEYMVTMLRKCWDFDFKFYQIRYIIYLEFDTFLCDLSWSIAVIRGHSRSNVDNCGQICFVRTEHPGSGPKSWSAQSFLVRSNFSKRRQSYLLIWPKSPSDLTFECGFSAHTMVQTPIFLNLKARTLTTSSRGRDSNSRNEIAIIW